MSEISFEEDNFGASIKAQAFSVENRESSSGGMVGFLVQKNIVSSQKQATIFLVIISIILLASSVFFFQQTTTSSSKTKLEPFENLPIEMQQDPNIIEFYSIQKK
jgi:hypothetical protein